MAHGGVTMHSCRTWGVKQGKKYFRSTEMRNIYSVLGKVTFREGNLHFVWLPMCVRLIGCSTALGVAARDCETRRNELAVFIRFAPRENKGEGDNDFIWFR